MAKSPRYFKAKDGKKNYRYDPHEGTWELNGERTSEFYIPDRIFMRWRKWNRKLFNNEFAIPPIRHRSRP